MQIFLGFVISLTQSNNIVVNVDKLSVDYIVKLIVIRQPSVILLSFNIVWLWIENNIFSKWFWIVNLQNPDGRQMQMNLTGFLNAKNARTFIQELWELLLSAQENIGGIPAVFLEQKKEEIKMRQVKIISFVSKCMCVL